MSFTEDLTRMWGDRIRKARQEQGLSLEALAERAGMDAGHLSRGERGLAGIGDDNRIRLASALGRRVEDLFPYPAESPCPTASSAAGPVTPAKSPTTPSTTTSTAATRPSAPAAGSATAPEASAPPAGPSTGDA